jgi:DNA-binding response OmpR family regulator
MKNDARLANRLRPEWFTRSHPAAPRAEAPRILIADDQASSRLGFRAVLEPAGYEVIEAGDGEQALKSLRDDPADVALLDSEMAGLDGLEVLRRLKDEGIEVPIVVVTAHGSIPIAIRAMELGAMDVLIKPVETALLRETILDVLVRRARAGTESYRPAPASLGGAAHRFVDILAVARRALKGGHFDLAEYLLQQALELDPDSAEALTLHGALHEALGEHHAAYQSYQRALSHDPHQGTALDGMRRYCERFGLDPRSKAINPGAE